jgi:hypothetical protein
MQPKLCSGKPISSSNCLQSEQGAACMNFASLSSSAKFAIGYLLVCGMLAAMRVLVLAVRK